MAVKIYDDEEKEQEQASQSKTTGGSEWLSGEALARSQKMKTTTQVVNLSKLTDESAKNIASRIQNENDRNSFLSEYAYSKSPTYNASEHNILKGLMSTGITHTAGSLNLYEADMDTLIRSVQAIPETERRKSAYAYLKALTKVKDGRFYKAYSFGDTKDPGYIETLDFDKAGYDERVKGYQGIFYMGDGHDEENLRAYVDAYDKINQTSTSDQQYYWYMRALDDAFGEQTGYSAPDVTKARQALFAYDQKNAAQETGEGEETEKPGGFSQFLASIGESVGSIFVGKKEDSAEADTEKATEPTPAVSPLPTPPAPVPEATPQPPQETPAPEAAEAEEAPAEVQGPPAQTATPAPAASQEAQEPVAVPSEAPEVQGPPAPQQTQEEQQAPAPGSVNLTGDPVRAITQYVKQGRGNELDEETRQAVNDYIGSSKSAQVVMGLDAAGTVGMYEEAETDPFALSRANAARFDLYAGNVSSVIGSTLGGYYARISSESFPASLRDDALGVLMDVGRAAEDAYRSGAIDVPENGNLYEAYLSANPRALDNLKGAFTTLYEMDKEARKQARQTEEQAALAEKERLDIARAHVRSGDFTAEDYALVEAQAPVISTADAMDDETYADALIELRGAVSASYREEGGWFNEQTESYLRAVGLNVAMDSAVALDYKDTLAGYVQDEMLSDLRVAKALGYDSLGAYYDRQGGMSLDNLYARATLSMESFGQSLTQEDMDAAQALVYQGTGEDVGALDVLGAGVKLGTASTGGELLEAIWTMGQNANANRADLQSAMRSEYTQKWGPALAAYMFTQDWMNALDSGATPSEEYAQYVRDYIASGADVFLMGPPPSMDSAVLRGAVGADAAVADTMQYVTQSMNANQGRWVDIISNTTSNVEMQAMATVITGLTGSPTMGTALSFGLAEYSPTVREQLANGRTLSQANAMGMAHAATTAIANAPTSGKFTGKIFGALGITPAVVNGAALAGSTAPAKTMAGMIKAFGTGFLKGTGEMAVDELLIDEAKERGLWALASGTGEAMMDGAGVLEAVGAGLAGADPAQIGRDILADAPEGFVCMLPMIFMGGLSDGVSGVKANWPKTTRAAQKLAQTGTAQAAQEFVAAMNEEIQNPQARQELNDAMSSAAAGQAAAGAMLTDPDIRQKAESAQKSIEQAQSHEATLEAETARREVAREGYEHAKEIGDVDAQLAAMDEYTKASHNMADAQKEAQQKRTEADSLAAQAVGEALKKGEAYAAEERRRTISLIAEIGMEYEDAAKDRQIQRRIDGLYAEANKAFEAGDEVTAEELATQAGYLSVYLDDRQRAREAQTQAERDAILNEANALYDSLTEKSKESAEHPQSEESRALESAWESQRKIEAERVELGPVFKTLRGQKIYVDDAQRKEILYLTGAKNLSEANRLLGTRLTGNANGGKAVHVDSSWYQDFKALAPGYFSDEWDAHPEYAIVSLGQRMKSMSGEIRDAKGKTKNALERWKSRDSQESQKNGQERKINRAVISEDSATGNNSKQVSAKARKAEESVLSSLQTLAQKAGIGLRVKSDGRFATKGYRPDDKVAGYYINGERNAIVRSKQAGKISVTGHEIGHAIQDQIGFVSTDKMIESWKAQFPSVSGYAEAEYGNEAFAEFFWRYLADRNAAVDFADEETVSSMERLLREKGLYKDVQKAQGQITRYLNASAREKIGARIINRSDAKKRQDTGLVRRIETAFLDDTAIAEDVQDVIRNATGDKVVSIEDNLRSTILFNRRASARASYILTDALVDKKGNVVYKSLSSAFSDAGIKGKDFDLFWEYELAKHSLDRDSVKGAKDQVFDEESLSTQERKSFVEQTEREHPEFKKANSEFQKWRRKFLDTYLVDEGFLGENGKAILDALNEVYPNYVPTYRDKGKRGKGNGRTYQMRTATGSTEDIIHPLDSFVGMVNSIVQMTADNDSKRKFAEIFDKYKDAESGEPGRGMGYFAREITQDVERVSVSTKDIRQEVTQILESLNTDPDAITKISGIIGDEKVEYRGTGRVDMNNVITVRNEDGSNRYFEIYNPELFTLLAGADNGRSGLLGKTIGPLTRVMGMLTTGSNPVFGITNAMRDFQNSVNYGSWASNYLTGALKWAATLWDVATKSSVSKEYDALGGAGWQMFDTASKKSAEQLRGELFKGYSTSNPVRAAKTVARGAFKLATMEKVNEVIEKTSRLAEYKYGQHDRSTAQGRMEAFLAAQDATTDFSRHGGNAAILSDLKSLVPFFNASLQGVYRTARQVTDQESGRARTRFAKNVLNVALASALANAMILKYSDDDDVEEFAYLSDDLRAKHMFLPNFAPDVFGDAPFIRIPLDQNPLSYAVNAAVSNFIWTGAGADNEAMIEISALADAILDNLNPVSSTILDPFIATQTNKSWYGSNIVPTYLQSYEPVNQYAEDTPTAFVTASKWISDAGVQISPMMLKYMAEQYSGFLGQTVIPALQSEKGDERGLLTRLSQSLISTARKRVTSDPLTSNDVISQVYDSYYDMTAVQKEGRSERVFDVQYLDPAMSSTKAQAAVDEAYRLTHKGGALYEAKNAITDGYNRIDEIDAMENLTDTEKTELERAVRREMIEAALDAKEAMEDYDAKYRYKGILPRYFYGAMLDLTK